MESKIANLVDLKFESADGASQALELVKPLQSQYSIELFDATAVSLAAEEKKLGRQQFVPTLGWSTLDRVFWGMLFGLIFFAPFLGLATGTAIGAISGKITDYGINDNIIKSVHAKITDGTPTIFLLTDDSTSNKVVDAVKQMPKFELISLNPSKEREGLL
jgi:uncharacterized membrane protein